MAKIGDLYYSVTVDDTGLAATLKRLKAELKGLDNQIVSSSQIASGGQLSRGLDMQGRSIEQVRNQMRLLEAAYRKLDMDGDTAGAERMRAKWLELQQQLQRYGVTVRNAMMEYRGFNQTMAMQATTVEQIIAKMKALEQARLRENTTTAAGRKNIATMNAEYDKLNRKLQDLGIRQRNFNDGIVNMGRIANEVKGQIQALYSIYALERFIKKVIDVRSQFELQQTSLRAILQDKYAADQIFAQVVELGLKSPFTTMEINSYVKQLAAYRIETEDLFDTTKRLADVSAGLGVDMQRLILAYGQVRAASVLRGQEVRQFTEAGIPLIEELADKMTLLEGKTVSTAEVFDRISKRMVSFEMVKEIFEDLTDVGGIFYNMQEIQSETLYGKVQNLSDAFDLMFNQIGEANDGVLKTSVDILWALADNWEKVAAVIKPVIAAYATYKAFVIGGWMLQQIKYLTTNITLTRLFTRELGLATAAQQAFNTASKANIYGALAAAVIGVVTALGELTDKTSALDESLKKLEFSSKRYLDSTKGLDKAIDRYEQLSKKTNLTEKEQQRLNAITQELAKQIPNATQAIDKQTSAIHNQGRALSLNIERMREYSREQRELFKKMYIVDLRDAQKELGLLQQRANRYVTSERLVGGRDANGKAVWKRERYVNPNRITSKEDREAWSKLNEQITETEYKIQKIQSDIAEMSDMDKPYDADDWAGGIISYLNREGVASEKYINQMKKGRSDFIKWIREQNEEDKKTLAEEKDGEIFTSVKRSNETLRQNVKLYQKISEIGVFSLKTQKELSKEQNKEAKETEKAEKKTARDLLDSEKEKTNNYKREIELIEKVRQAYNDLHNSALSLDDNTVEGKKLYNNQLENIPNQLRELFKGNDFAEILDNEFFKDENYKGLLSGIEVDITNFREKISKSLSELGADVNDSNKESVADFINDLILKSTEVDFNNTKQEQDRVLKLLKDARDARNKIFTEEPPEGTGFAFRLSKIMTDTRNNVTEKSKEITKALVGATEEQKISLNELQAAWENAYNEEGLQKAESLAQSFFNESLKKQKLDIDMSSLSSATMYQLNRLRDALKSIEADFTGDKLIDAFDAVGLSIDDLKGKIDTTNLQTVSSSLLDLATFTPEDIKLTEEQKKSLEAIAKIVNTLYQNNKKGLFDIKLEKLEKSKKIADEIFSSFSQIGSALEQLADATGDEGLRSLAQDMQFAAQMAQNIGDIVVGALSGNPQEIIKGVTNTVVLLINAEAAYQKARIEFMNKQREMQIDYNKLLIQQIKLQKDAADGILYDDMLNEFQQTFSASQTAIKKMDELLNGSSISNYLGGIDVQTGVKRKKFLGITTGSKAVYGDLLETYPKLIDENGKLDLEYAKLVLSQNEFAGNGKIALTELVEYTEQYEEAMKSLDDQISSMFGEVGSIISDTLINSFHNGTLAAGEFFDSVNKGIGDMLDALVTNMIVSSIFGDIMDKYPDMIKNALLGSNPESDVTTLMGNLAKELAGGYDQAAIAMNAYDKAKQNAGLGNVGDDTRTGLSGSLARASQESIDELTGVMYAGLEKLSLTASNTNAININVTAMSAELKTQTALLRSIDGYSSRLPYIETGIDTLVKGVKIKP